ncbi:Zn-dependent protease [Streptomyces sp. Amel2xB2]|uniref:site-2 protease family protein n=1 Tax=Streptomyces sp. Amel2xB2 TaxID=1305829 RepID=UPI000DBF9C9F|nr:site-2 protease family protein [Streptomyces sp. Amel2xB2]RAJ60044.1 Zn-dependent protease [Streptomyces sp. Amel2xB2]
MADTENGGRPHSGGPGGSGESGTAEGASPRPDRPDAPAYPEAKPDRARPADAGTSGGDASDGTSEPSNRPSPVPGSAPAGEDGTGAEAPSGSRPGGADGRADSGTGAGANGAAGAAGSDSGSDPDPVPNSRPGSGHSGPARDSADSGGPSDSGSGSGTGPPSTPGSGPPSAPGPGSAPGSDPDPGQGPLGPDKPRRARPFGGGILMGRPFGVPVYVAPSWFLVAALITWVFGGQLDRVLPHLGSLRYLIALFFAVAFYASVLVHELAHTVAALRFQLPVRRIQLQFFGGVSEIEKEAESPGREFVLAGVGPLLSLVLAGVFYGGMRVVEPGTVPGVLLAGLMISNLFVAAFNLLPGLPLDGGRMLRALVWKLSGRPMTGTVFAAWIGRALAIAVLIGLPLATHAGGFTQESFGGVNSLMDALLAAILAAIIWTGAGNSLRMARLREHLPELRARTLTRRAVPVPTDTPLSEALRRANEAGARALVVVDGSGGPVSLVREAAIAGVPSHRRPWVEVSTLAQDLKEGMRVPAELAGEELLEHLRATPATEYLVVEQTGEIYGVLSTGDVERAFVAAMAKPSAQTR